MGNFSKKFIKQEVIFYVITKKSYLIPCALIWACAIIGDTRVGMVMFELVRLGLVRSGMVRLGLVRLGISSHSMKNMLGLVWKGMLR